MSVEIFPSAVKNLPEKPRTIVVNQQRAVIYWHRQLPPLEAETLGEHTLEAISGRVPDTIAHRDELWNQCKDSLMVHANNRLAEEISRLGGRFAHVLDESIDVKHDRAAGEAWLHGRFTYMLYR
jgi:hypothetical protein